MTCTLRRAKPIPSPWPTGYFLVCRDLGRRMKQLRLRLGISQERAVEIMRVSRVTINAWESGRKYPGSKHLLAWTDMVLLIELEHLLSWHGKQELPRDLVVVPKCRANSSRKPTEADRLAGLRKRKKA